MLHFRSTTLLVLPLLVIPCVAYGQAGDPLKPLNSSASASEGKQRGDQPSASAPASAPIPRDAQHMSKQTRFEIIRDFETQLVYARTAFPMGAKGLHLKEGVLTPNGEELRQALTIWGPAVKAGDPAHISFVQIKADHIHFEINGGPVHRKKWYQHIEVSGAGGAVPVPQNDPQNKEQAYLDTVPPKVKEAIQAHHVLVGMNQEMVLHAKGKPPKKVRERDGETEYEEWIYGEPPADVDFVRIVGEEVVRVETMKVGGEKIVRTEKEIILAQPEREARKEPEVRSPNAPSLRRPGEDSEDVPKPANGAAPMPPVPPPDLPQPGGPGEIVTTR